MLNTYAKVVEAPQMIVWHYENFGNLICEGNINAEAQFMYIRPPACLWGGREQVVNYVFSNINATVSRGKERRSIVDGFFLDIPCNEFRGFSVNVPLVQPTTFRIITSDAVTMDATSFGTFTAPFSLDLWLAIV